MVKHHVWKVFSFSGWFVLLVGIIFGMLYASIKMGAEMYGAGLLVIVGVILILIGEYLLAGYKNHTLMMVFNAMSIGGAFSLTVGIIWLVIQFLSVYESWFGIVVLLAVGLGLVIIGESVKIEK